MVQDFSLHVYECLPGCVCNVLERRKTTVDMGRDTKGDVLCVMRPLIPKYEMLPSSDDSHRTPKHEAFTTARLTDRGVNDNSHL